MSNLSACLIRFSELYKLPSKPQLEVDTSKPIGVKVENGSFSWKTGGAPTITGLNFEVRPGELVICIGTVGSGKTTLLNTILHETIQTEGKLDVNGTLAYVEQEPFIYSATISENICMGRPYDAKRFAYAIEVS